MPELRQNLITRDWVIISTERQHRPDDFARHVKKAARPEHRDDCPFCPGNEDETEVETLRIDGDAGWRLRVVRNKYPVLVPEGARVRREHGIFRSISGVGAHEVVIEHPSHATSPAEMSGADVATLVEVYRSRYRTLAEDPRIEHIVVFKNHGETAGTSLEHPHSQIAATPVVPAQVRTRMEEAIRWLDERGECLFCRVLAEELAARERVVTESEHFVAFVPWAALSPFHTWIFPRRHVSSFGDTTDEELADLSRTLHAVLGKLFRGLGDPDYNFSIRSCPTHDGPTAHFHWYLTVVPRVARAAGFELGSGMFVNTAMPEESAAFLRAQ
ncbi:galactose-1-phosphate uridylyltransferase [Myxococcota bacterium]|nr:galactose-1-phosphate uridylyltransferase [Myxococcota bacterium]